MRADHKNYLFYTQNTLYLNDFFNYLKVSGPASMTLLLGLQNNGQQLIIIAILQSFPFQLNYQKDYLTLKTKKQNLDRIS